MKYNAIESPDMGLVWKVYTDFFRGFPLGNAMDLGDLLQEGYAKLLEADSKFVDDGRVKRSTFLYFSVKHHLINYLAKNKNNIGMDSRALKKQKVNVGTLSWSMSDKEEGYAEVLTFFDDFNELEEKEYIEMFMEQLTEEERMITAMRMKEIKWVDIAKQMGISRQLLMHRVKKLEQKLIDYMSLRG